MSADLRRGDVVLVTVPGDFGKPRPALVIQADVFLDNPPSITMALITTTRSGSTLFRVALNPSEGNGLRDASFIMCDKIVSHLPDKVRKRIGSLDAEAMAHVDVGVRLWLGLI